MKFKAKDRVRDRNTLLTGEVVVVYPDWESVRIGSDKEAWFNGLEYKPTTKNQPWYRVIVSGGGSIVSPEEFLEAEGRGGGGNGQKT